MIFFSISDVQDLFPARDLTKSNLTVIIISQKTHNDMTGWSPEVEDEREELLAAVSKKNFKSIPWSSISF